MPKTPFHSHKAGKEPKCMGIKRPSFEDAINFYIDNENDRARALSFSKWLRENKLSPITGTNGYNWYIDFKYIDCNTVKNGEHYRGTYHGCYIKLFNDTWHILPSKDILEQVLLCEDLKEVLWRSTFPCYGCNYGCFKHTHNTQYKREILGREFAGKGICLRQPLCLTNPDDFSLGVLKEILLTRKEGEDLKITEGMNIYSYGMV